ncbi:PDZ domain-containing protein [Spirosoma spitsbergense]|uniref:PDZ domain-containing protein n=1 Tax=Spirosoma spitsbergense TaxID=431554 RepID=UPI00036F03B5|nr:PDZ domain-containing protein [Spirosoma spitsbergense]
MKKRTQPMLRLLLALVLCPLGAFSQTSFYVSLNGSDTNPGTRAKPFASINRALVTARRTAGPVSIRLFGGTYHLTQPIRFTSADSRKDKEPLTLTSVDNQPVVLSGGTVLTNLNWKEGPNGIWQTPVTQDLVFDELLVNGQRQRMARYPNYDPSARFLGGTAADAVSAERAVRWKSPAGGYVHALHRSEWGDFHYRITGKNDKGEPTLEGGWQNNRRMGMHVRHRFVENVFEELDTTNEWYYDKTAKVLFFDPPKGLAFKTATFETPQLAHLVEFNGTEANPVKNIHLVGLTLTQTIRTFMLNREPLLRSDWTIYRGGAVLYEGAMNCNLNNCTLYNLGSNGVFYNNFNRNCQVSGCLIWEIGASAVCFVGDPRAVRSPSFEYNQFVPLPQIDRTPGPMTTNYPADCKVFDNLMFDLGYVEKQSAGVELSMCQGITVSHNTIYDVPRAGINVSEGTWGGHIIEYNDVFNTVKESGDHGSFNSWGRDRYWHPNKRVLDSIVATNYNLALLDVVKPIILRYNRMRCDHGWDIDLDDGSSNYLIYNNLCLNGGIKLREGVGRVVENNIMINNTFHPHVWFKNSHDVFRHNIVTTGYLPIGITNWGNGIDHNIFPDSVALAEARQRGTDQHSVSGDPQFVNPGSGDFRVKSGSIALAAGFKNFPMDSFGVVSPRLKMLAKAVPQPTVLKLEKIGDTESAQFMGATVKNLTTLGERSATGMEAARGVLVVGVPSGTEAAKFLQVNDVILSFNDKKINTLRDLFESRLLVIGSSTNVLIFRNQKELKQGIRLNAFKKG